MWDLIVIAIITYITLAGLNADRAWRRKNEVENELNKIQDQINYYTNLKNENNESLQQNIETNINLQEKRKQLVEIKEVNNKTRDGMHFLVFTTRMIIIGIILFLFSKGMILNKLFEYIETILQQPLQY